MRPIATEVTGAYPRSRGATLRAQVANLIEQGLSPLARGNQL